MSMSSHIPSFLGREDIIASDDDIVIVVDGDFGTRCS
jgi:hypothetical protein